MPCGHCQAELRPGARFCRACGTPVPEAPSTPPPFPPTPPASVLRAPAPPPPEAGLRAPATGARGPWLWVGGGLILSLLVGGLLFGGKGTTPARAPEAPIPVPVAVAPPPPPPPSADSQRLESLAQKAWKVMVFAGGLGEKGHQDGARQEARLSSPKGMATDGREIFLCDTGNHVIRRLDPVTGAVGTLAGIPGEKGHQNGAMAQARFHFPSGVAVMGRQLYVSDSGNHVLRVVDLDTGTVRTVAGMPGKAGAVDGRGEQARLFWPDGLLVQGEQLLLADGNNSTIRTFDPGTGELRTLAGTPGRHGREDGRPGRFDHPFSLAAGGEGLWVCDYKNQAIRRLDPRTGDVSTASFLPPGFRQPSGIAWADQGLWVLSHEDQGLVLADPAAKKAWVLKLAFLGADGQSPATGFSRPFALLPFQGWLYISDMSQHVIRRVSLEAGEPVVPVAPADPLGGEAGASASYASSATPSS